MGKALSRTAKIGGAGGVVVIAAGQTKPEDAISNLGGWLKLAGVDHVPAFLNTLQADAWATALGILVAFASAAVLIWQRWRDRPATINDWLRSQRPSTEQAAYREELAREQARQDAKLNRKIERVKGEMAGWALAKEHRLSVETWVPLSHALQYLIRESAWARSVTLGPRADPEDIIRREFFDAAARGDLEPWAVEVLDRQSTPWKLAASRATIPVEFWKYAWMQPFAEIWQNDAKRAMVCTDGHLPAPRKQAFLETSIRRSELESTWAKAPPAVDGTASPLETAFERWVRSSLDDPDWEFDDESELISRDAPPSQPGRRKPAAVLPDITLAEVINRVLKIRGLSDDGSAEALRKIREIGQDIGDQMSLRKLSTWGRLRGTLEPLPFEISRRGFGVGRDAAGNIYCMKQFKNEDGAIQNVTDLRFLAAEINEVWPDE